LWVVLSMSRWDCLLIQRDFSAPPPSSPPPTLSWFYNFSVWIRTGSPVRASVLAKLLAWLCVLKTYLLLPPTSRTPFRLTNFSAFSENSTFEFLTRFCFNRFGVPLVSNPSLRRFLHTICQRFCQTSEHCPNPRFFLLFNGQWWEGAGEGDETRVDLCLNTDFFTDKTRPIYTFQPLHCNEKFIHAAGNHHWSRQNIRLVRTGVKKIRVFAILRPNS
jgi:hypothetical protein